MGGRKFNWMIQTPGKWLVLTTVVVKALSVGINEYKKINSRKSE